MQNFYFKKMHLQISSEKWRSFFPRGNELINQSKQAIESQQGEFLDLRARKSFTGGGGGGGLGE